LKTFNPLVNKIINKITDLLIRKIIDAEKLDKAIIDYLATSDCYKHVNLGLAVVVDIESAL
jgi:Trm5-related predicted tRNA methylase